MTNRILIAALGMVLSFTAFGCSTQNALRDGVEDGVTSAVAALIEAPVQAWIDTTFGG